MTLILSSMDFDIQLGCENHEIVKAYTDKTEEDFRSGLLPFAYHHKDHWHLLMIDQNGDVRDDLVIDAYTEEPSVERFFTLLGNDCELTYLGGAYEGKNSKKKVKKKISLYMTPEICDKVNAAIKLGHCYNGIYESDGKDKGRNASASSPPALTQSPLPHPVAR